MAVAAPVAPPENLSFSRRHAAATPLPGRQRWRRFAVASLLTYSVLTGIVTYRSLQLNGGHLVYTLDDPYIHLAMARTWLDSGAIGISPGHFAPASSSPLWTFLLTLLSYFLRPREWLPFALNVAACLLLLTVFWWGSAAVGTGARPGPPRPIHRWWYLAAIMLPVLAHLPGLTLSGLEHPLHAAVTIAFTVALFRVLQREERPWRSGLYLLAFLLPLVRLEGAFAVGIGILLLLAHRQHLAALIVAIVGAGPNLIMGLHLRQANGAFFSNSIMAKAVPQTDLAGWASYLRHQLVVNLDLDPSLRAVALVALIWLYFAWRAQRRSAIEEAVYFLGALALHLLFSSVGWFDRYQAYLVTLGLFFFTRHTWQRSLPNPVRLIRQQPALGAGLACFLLLGFGYNKVADLLATPLAANNIYEQQYQMGRFVAEYYPHGAIVANDVGVIAYRAGGTVTDLAGLGSSDVLRLVRANGGRHGLTSAEVEPILRRNGADVIVIYPGWYSPELYSRWYRVATWTIGKKQVTPAYPGVVFFAHTAGQYPVLLSRLKAFQSQLPNDVVVAYDSPPKAP